MADISKIKLPGDSTGRSIKDASARTVQYTATLSASGWSNNQYVLSVPTLTCGSDGTVSPTITYTSNQEEYNYISSATADSSAHTITFVTS